MELMMNLLIMLGGVAVFMYGMKQMSQGLEQGSGLGVRKLFQKINVNRSVDYGIGIGATAIVQSSSATSIMTVGLANAGIVNVKQGSGIILGAKVGTTLTAFIFALSGTGSGGFSVSAIFASLAFVGVIITFTTKNDSLNKLAVFLIGFGMLFVGLEVMEFAIGGKDSVLSVELQKLFQYEIMQNPLLLVVLGILFTCIIQSSTAATGVFLIFLATGVIHSIDQSFFLVMGANIGTCSDGLMASIGTNANGKRIAFFHVLSSTIGATAFSVILVLFRSPIMGLFESIFADNSLWSLATFNLAYNLIYTLILLAFLDPLINFVKKAIKEQPKTEIVYTVDERLLATPMMAVGQALKEVRTMSKIAWDNFSRAFDGILNEDMAQSKKIASEEYLIDNMTRALAGFFVQLSPAIISNKYKKMVGGLHHVINDIERIGDHAVLLAIETNYMIKGETHFLVHTKEELREIYDRITEMYTLGSHAFKTRKSDNLKRVSEIHVDVIALIDATMDSHIERLSSNMYSVEVSKSVYAVLQTLHRVADHIVNIAFSIHSETGSKKEAFENLEKFR
jgi:phosphate:Na+ symporter